MWTLFNGKKALLLVLLINSSGLSAQEFIHETIDIMNKVLPIESRVLVIPTYNYVGVEIKDGLQLANLARDIVEAYYTVREPNKIILITRDAFVAAEKKYQLSGEVSDELGVRIGHEVGAQYLIIFEIQSITVNTYCVWLYKSRIIDIEKGVTLSNIIESKEY